MNPEVRTLEPLVLEVIALVETDSTMDAERLCIGLVDGVALVAVKLDGKSDIPLPGSVEGAVRGD